MDNLTSADITTPEEKTFRIDAKLAAKLNLADFQNAVPMLRQLFVVNNSARNSSNLELRIYSVPAFLKPKTWRIDSLNAGKSLPITDLDLQLDGALFTRMTEAETATVTLTLQRQDGSEIARWNQQIELLPRNQWGGLSHQLPELVAAFVQPNEPAVERLLKQAADILRKNGKSAALDGYSGGAKRAWELTSSIWSAVAAMGLDYALPPPSFEQTGQKIRGPSQVTESGLATCMDLALLFCAALEHAGLNPLLVFTKGHAFTGVWLNADEFSTAIVDDVSALRKRVKLKEILLFETTLATQRPAPSLSVASLNAEHQISQEKDEAFEMAVDIRRARLQRIKPLANAKMGLISDLSTPLSIAEPILEEAPELPEDGRTADPDPSTLNPKDRLARWQRKLLDLSLRNNLLNFKSGKKALKLEAPDAGALEDLLSDGAALKLLAKPNLMEGSDPRSQAIHESREREDLRRAHALDALKRREVYIGVPLDELEPRLVDLYRAARNTLQEGGANTLYIALGFLCWSRDDKSGTKYRAPLILLPVTLHRKSVRSGFTLVLHDDEPRFNPTLIEMLRQDFKLDLGVADGELPRDDSGLAVRIIWNRVSQAVKGIKGWEVAEDVVLAMFSFAKYLMWKDLSERAEQLRENPVVKHLIDTPRASYPAGTGFPNPRRLDQEFSPEKIFCPLPADSSQLSAVMAAVKGKDFVLIGPPGTGKSQTICNLIAQCLAEGKRVLFVSEKIAALDVVYRRLREVKLGEFCLELHSSKARKLDVLAQLQRAWEAKGDVDPEAWRAQAQRLKRLRDELNIYVERLHFAHGNGLTIYKAIARVVEGENVPAPGLSWLNPSIHKIADLEALREVAVRLEVHANAVGQSALLDSALTPVAHTEWSPSWQQGLLAAARGVLTAAQAVKSSFERLSNSIGLPVLPITQRARGAMGLLARSLAFTAGRDWRFVLHDTELTVAARLRLGAALATKHREITAQLSPGWQTSVVTASQQGMRLLEQRRETYAALAKPYPADVLDGLTNGLALLEQITNAVQKLSVKYGDEIEQINVNQLHRSWIKAEKTLWPLSWFAKRKLRAALDAAIIGAGEPDVASDLAILVRLRALRAKVSALDIATQTDGIWAGLKTRPELAAAAVKLQGALAAAQHDQQWEDTGLDAVTNGRCGDRLARALNQLRLLKRLDAEISALKYLGPPTAGLWAGLETRSEYLKSALDFNADRERIREAGTSFSDHPLVASLHCGKELSADLKRLRERATVEQQLIGFEDLNAITAGLWNRHRTDLNELTNALRFQTAIATAIANLATTPEDITAIKTALDRLLGSRNALLKPGGRISVDGQAYIEACSSLKLAIDRLSSEGGFAEPSKTRFTDLALPELIQHCMAILESESRLQVWCAWRKVCQQASLLGLAPLVDAIEKGSIAIASQAEQVLRAFETAYSRWWLNAVVDNEPVIRAFVAAEHEKRIGDFRALEKQYTDLTSAWVRATLCADLPKQDGVPRNSEWGILRHEITKKRAHLPMRQLMNSIPQVLTKLTPCLLMSPLSIAQYLSANANAFDVVVFDEASQIPVWDAVGAIARGKQVVMVGDPKQLPPSNFFDRAESQDDEEDSEGDLESILDECLGANLPTMNLTWHYRSRSESLIAFSNHHYYGGALITFPSPVTEDKAVSFHHVSGVYEKGGARINKPEAMALVADIIARLKSEGFRESKLTIGVVTFNSEQQALIEDLLDEERRRDPALEPHFSEEALEPLFVKNLESVQGDERDIMYFSITYGPDLAGAVSMNFGPMNRIGGERRLNVAITRARHELRVYSSLKGEQLNLARTQSLGVQDLKRFLEFAERGPRALAESTRGSQGDFESPFEEAVASALTKNGWELHTQIGASTFRVDLAVVHPDAPGSYLTGIECDGATYHRSATARDRDMLREQVLRGLGWEILRVWSTDWWVDRATTLLKLESQLRQLLQISRELRAKQAEAAKRQATIKKAAVAVSETAKACEALLTPNSVTGERVELKANVHAKNAFVEPDALLDTFVESDPAAVVAGVDADAFFDSAYDCVLEQMIAHVIQVEGPILDSVLARKIARAHGWQRTGTRIQDRVLALAAMAITTIEADLGTFYWAKERSPDMPVRFRRAAEASARKVDEICMAELAQLAAQIKPRVKNTEEAIVKMARELGLRRLSVSSRYRLQAALEFTQKH